MLTTSFSQIGFHATHYGGCAILLNKDTFFLDIKVKSIYLHDIRHDLPDEVLKENRVGSYKVFNRVLLFDGNRPAAKNPSQ